MSVGEIFLVSLALLTEQMAKSRQIPTNYSLKTDTLHMHQTNNIKQKSYRIKDNISPASLL